MQKLSKAKFVKVRYLDFWFNKIIRDRGLFFFLNLFILFLLLYLKFYSGTEYERITSSFQLLIRNLFPVFLIGVPVILGNRLVSRIIFISFILFFLIGEGITRTGVLSNLTMKSWDHSNFYRYPKPFVEFSGKPNASTFFLPYAKMGGSIEDATITLNQLGFRGEVPSADKDEEFRIFVLGGSTVFNGIPLSKSISGELEQLFHKDGFLKVRVYNWGVISYNSGQELSLLVHSVTDFKPDLVIIYDGANDVYHSYAFEPRPGYPYNWQTYEAGVSLIRNGPSLSQAVNLLFLKSRLVTSVFGESLKSRIVGAKKLTPLSPEDLDKLSQTTVRAYISNIKKMCNFSRGNDFGLNVVLQPVILLKNPLVGLETNLLGTEEIQTYVKRSYQILEKEFEILKASSENNNRCNFDDFSKIFIDYNRETYWDFVHTNNDGNKHIAGQIYNSIKDQFEEMGLGKNANY